MSVFGVFQVRIQSECGKIRTRKTPNTEPFQALFHEPGIPEKTEMIWT